MKARLLAAALLSMLYSCAPIPAPSTPDAATIASWTTTCRALWQEELGRQIDPPALDDCLKQHRPAGEQRAILRASAEWANRQAALAAATQAATLPSGSEHVQLHTNGKRFVREDGTTWRGKGFSDFNLLAKFARGEDIQPILTERIQLGANYVRVFMMLDNVGHLAPADSLANLSAFLSLLEARGLRAEVVVFADLPTHPAFDQHGYLTQVATILNAHGGIHLGELCNECTHPANRVDYAAFQKPTGPTLWSHGSNLGDGDPYEPVWDYVSDHPGRNDEWMRRINCRDSPQVIAANAPCLEDEPMGASATDQPGKRSANAADFGYFGGICGEWSQGCLFHSDSGILSELLGPAEHAAAVSFFAGLNFAPADAPSWPYQRGDNCGSCPGVGDMPVAQWDLPAPHGSLRTVARGDGATEWVVAVRPADCPYVPVVRAPWRVAEQSGPCQAFVRLTR